MKLNYITDKQVDRINAYLRERFLRAAEPTPVDFALVAAAVERFYASLRLDPPKIALAPNPVVAELSARIGTGLYAWLRHGDAADLIVAQADTITRSTRSSRSHGSSGLFSALEIYPIDWTPLLRERAIHRSTMSAWENNWMASPADLEGFSLETIGAIAEVAKPSELQRPDQADYRHEPQEYTHLETRRAIGYDLVQNLSAKDHNLSRLLDECVLRLDYEASRIHSYPTDRFVTWFEENILPKGSTNNNEDLELIKRECADVWFHKDFCIISDHPQTISLDAVGRLHCEDGPAVRWRGGVSQYFLHGISVSRKLVEAPDTLRVQDIATENNAAIRRLMLDRYGESKFLLALGARPIHEDECGVLYQQDFQNDEPLTMVRVKDGTPDANGNHAHYFLRVPPNMRTAREAVAWTFAMKPKQYKPVVET